MVLLYIKVRDAERHFWNVMFHNDSVDAMAVSHPVAVRIAQALVREEPTG